MPTCSATGNENQRAIFRLDGRFVTGLGRKHPIENGFTWHHTLGVPYLPGSAVKGVARAWARKWLQADGQEVRRVFGEEAPSKPRSVGSVIFCDALPVSPIELEADVMTPHYAPYCKDPEHVAPGDWHSPTPIPFLTAANGQSFALALAPREAEYAVDVGRVWAWLEEALSWMGAGAKTAVGYGRFAPDEEAQRAAQRERQQREEQARKDRERAAEEARVAAFSPIRRLMYQDGYDGDPERFMQNMGKWLLKVKSGDVSREERCEVTRLLAEWYQSAKKDQWQKPNPKNREKTNLIRSVLQECQWLGLTH